MASCRVSLVAPVVLVVALLLSSFGGEPPSSSSSSSWTGSSIIVAQALMRTSVKDCAPGSTETAPCAADVYMGEHFTIDCVSADDTSLPTPLSGGNYCETLADPTTTCSEKTLASTVATVVQGTTMATVYVLEAYNAAFKDVITYNVSCKKKSVNTLIYVSMKLHPYTRPLIAPITEKDCDASIDTTSSVNNPCRMYLWKTEKGSMKCGVSGTALLPTDIGTNSSGNVCKTGLATSTNGPKCASDSKETWITAWPGSGSTVITNSPTTTVGVENALLVTNAPHTTRWGGCTNSTNSGRMYTQLTLMKQTFTALPSSMPPMIKHVCTNTVSISSPCQIAVGNDEAVVIQCATFVNDTTNFKYAPTTVNQNDGSYCTQGFTAYDGTCAANKTGKWSDMGALVGMDPMLQYFVIALPGSTNTNAAPVTVHGKCGTSTAGTVFTLTMAASTTTTTTTTTTASPSAAYTAKSPTTWLMMCVLSLFAASSLAAVVM